MTTRERIALWLRPVFFLGHNKLTLAGAVVTTSSAATLILFWGFEIFSSRPVQPYLGIILFLVLPGIFVAGLALMPLGAILTRRRMKHRGELPEIYPQIDLKQPMLRRAVALVAGLTVVNVGILGAASYKGVEYMDSVQFCGQACHSVMEPEFTAYLNSPHQRVACVQCHIGPGAGWFVRSKLSGARQVLAVNFNTYSRPIPSPVLHLRPARETCEQCHWPQKFSGDKFIVRTRYLDDEKNTPQVTVLVLKIGGITFQGRTGIHGRHLDTFERIGYVTTDGRRQVIPRVTYVDDNGQTVEYNSTESPLKPEEMARAEVRKMDCLDCHNRPTHAFELPERAVDNAITLGKISREIPFVRKKAVELLRAEYPDRQTARQRLTASLLEFYRSSYPEFFASNRAAIETAAASIEAIYLRNVFPSMRLTWGTHPNNIGHEDFPGCFRCHSGSHTSKDGRVIRSDCDACHQILALGEEKPKILEDLGMK
jgi:hypothetical protein